MFDIGWAEGLLVAILALVVVGPRELPDLIRGLGAMMRRLRRYYRDGATALHQLQQEIELAGRPALVPPGKPEYWELLPDHVKALMETDAPLRDAGAYQAREAEFGRAVADLQRSDATAIPSSAPAQPRETPAS